MSSDPNLCRLQWWRIVKFVYNHYKGYFPASVRLLNAKAMRHIGWVTFPVVSVIQASREQCELSAKKIIIFYHGYFTNYVIDAFSLWCELLFVIVFSSTIHKGAPQIIMGCFNC